VQTNGCLFLDCPVWQCWDLQQQIDILELFSAFVGKMKHGEGKEQTAALADVPTCLKPLDCRIPPIAKHASYYTLCRKADLVAKLQTFFSD
jgi:hypothetical protein